MLLYLSATDSDENLKLTTNQTEVRLGDYYYLFCASQEPFGDMCGVSTADWCNGTGKINSTSSKYMASTASDTVVVLKFFITEDKFHEPQTFRCKARSCMSNVVSVGKYGEFNLEHMYTV